MLKCWSYRPEERPTFRYCLDILQSLRSNFEDAQINIENSSRNMVSSKSIKKSIFVVANHIACVQISCKHNSSNSVLLDFASNKKSYALIVILI